MSDNKPPIFSANSLQIATKIIAIYSIFYIITAFVPLFTDSGSENPLLPENHFAPIYFNAFVHLIILGIALWSILKKKYSWWIAGVSIAVVLTSRIFYQDIAIWVWSWS